MALRIRFVHALRSFSASADLTVEPGETVALVGPSGAGKTTVLRVVAGLLRPDDGFVALDDAVLLDTARRSTSPPERRRVGYLFQEYALFPHLDVWHNVRFGARSNADVAAAARALPDHGAGSCARHAALGRGAAAGRARACARARPGPAPPRRAALGARRAHARRGPGRPARAARRARPPDAPRHARLRGRRDARASRGRDQRRRGAAARIADRPRRPPARCVRRELHRGDRASRTGRRACATGCATSRSKEG